MNHSIGGTDDHLDPPLVRRATGGTRLRVAPLANAPDHLSAHWKYRGNIPCGILESGADGWVRVARLSEFTFQGEGTLLRIDTFVSKAGKSILTLIFETKGQYPQMVPIKVFGRLAEEAAAWTPGSVLSVSGRLGGRDWQGKVYGDIVANSVEVVTKAADGDLRGPPGVEPPSDLGAPPLVDDDVPF